MNVLRKQKWRKAQFHCDTIIGHLNLLHFQLALAIDILSIRQPSVAYSSTTQRSQIHALVHQEPFDPTSGAHRTILLSYIEGLKAHAGQDQLQMLHETCQDVIIERWLCWEMIESRIGFQMPLGGISSLPETMWKPFEDGLWRKVWAAIRATVPVTVQQEHEGTPLVRRGRSSSLRIRPPR